MEKNMKVAFLISGLSSQAPVFVVKDLITGLLQKKNIEISLFYLDSPVEVDFPIVAQKISLLEINSVLKKYDIVHSHGIRPDIITNFISKSIIKISTQHNIIYDQYKIIYNKLLAKSIEFIWISALRKKNYIIGIGDAAESYYKKKLNHSKIVNINNGRSPVNHILPENDIIFLKSLKTDYKIIGACTRAVKLKGHAQIIKALVDLPNYAFVLIGEGDYLTALKKLAYELNVYDRCHFLGHKKETYGYLEFFDVYALTSYSESVSIALIEAASAKKNIVCSNIPSNKYLFSDTEVSFFNLDNINSLKNAIIRCEETDFSPHSYRKYKQKYTTQKMVDDHYALYLNAINNRS